MTVRRVAGFTALFVVGPLVASASCSSASAPSSTTTPSLDAAAMTTVDSGSDATTASTSCPVSPTLAALCTGSDPSFTFFPPLLASDASTTSVPYSNEATFTSAACSAFVAAQAAGTVIQGATINSPTWDFPNDGDMFPPDDWITFEWEKGPTASNWLSNAFEGTAHASSTTGDAYVLVFTQGCTEIARVMLTDLYWTPDPPTWARLVNAVGPITATVTWVTFDADVVAQAPVASQSVTFKIVPDDGGADAGDDAIDETGDDASDAASE